jgi:YVTN family beta-propeller protein
MSKRWTFRLCVMFIVLVLLAAFAGFLLATPTVVGTIDVGARMLNMAIDPVTNRLYALRSDPRETVNLNDVAVIDITTGSVLTTIPLGGIPAGLTLSSATNRIYASVPNAQKIFVIDGATNNIVGELNLSERPTFIFVNPAGSKIYAGINDIPQLVILDSLTGAVQQTLTCHDVSDVEFDIVLSRVYVACSNSYRVLVLDAITNALITSIQFPDYTFPIGLTLNANANQLYISRWETDNVTVVDTTTFASVATITVGWRPGTIMYSPVSNQVYFTLGTEVGVIDAATNQFRGTISTGYVPSFFGLLGNRVYVGSNLDIFFSNPTFFPVVILSDSRFPENVVGVPTLTPVSFYRTEPFQADNLETQTNGAMTASGGMNNVSRDGTTGNTYARVLVQDGQFIRSAAEIGVPELLGQTILQAVNLYGMLPGGATVNPFNTSVNLCLKGSGVVYWIDAAATQRTPVVLNATRSGDYTCAAVPGSGMVVLVAGAGGSTAVQSSLVTNCRLTTLYMVNLREQPTTASAVLTALPYDTSYQVTESSSGWYRVIYQDTQGWVNANYVRTEGGCE